MSLELVSGKLMWVGKHMPHARTDIMRGEFVVVEYLAGERIETRMVLLGRETGNLKLVYALDSFGVTMSGRAVQISPGYTLLKGIPNRGEKEAPRPLQSTRHSKE